MDYNVIKRMKDKVRHFVVPLGVENHLERWGVSEENIHEMAWWEEMEIDGLTVGCAPARPLKHTATVKKKKHPAK